MSLKYEPASDAGAVPGRRDASRPLHLHPRQPHTLDTHSGSRMVDVRLPGKGNSNSHGARPVHLLISMIKGIRTLRRRGSWQARRRRTSTPSSAPTSRPTDPSTSTRVHPKPYTLHPKPYTLHPTPYTPHPTPYTLHPKPQTLNPKPQTLNPEP